MSREMAPLDFELLDTCGHVLRGEHGCEADQGDVGGDEKDGGGEGDGGGCSKMAVACVEQSGAEGPGHCGANGEGREGERGGKAEGGEAGAGEVEERGHGEGVVADAAMGEEVADVWDEGEMARGVEAVGEGRGNRETDEGECGVGKGDPAARGFRCVVCVFGAGEGCGEEHQEREVGGEGVVLLIGGEREEEEDEGGEEGEEEGGALGIVEISKRAMRKGQHVDGDEQSQDRMCQSQ